MHPEGNRRHMTLAHLQACLPWSIAYTDQFNRSQEAEGHRRTIHDILHVMKGLGRLAGACEKVDHGKPPGMTVEEFADNLTDLIVCSLHMATHNLLGVFDLEAAVIKKIEERNGIVLPPDPNVSN